MRTNEGTVDRVLRIVVGTVLVIIGAMAVSPVLTWVLVIVGIILVVTGAIGWCGLYAALGISTKKKETEPSAPADEPPPPQTE